jgi:hypothetical protein
MSRPRTGREDEGPYSSVGHWQRRAERAEAEATRLRADIQPAPPLPEVGCECCACQVLRRRQQEGS